MPKNISENAQDLLAGMIEYRFDRRMTFKDCLDHPWFTKPANVKINFETINRLKKYKADSLLKEAVMNQLIKQLSPQVTKQLREQFDAIDTDKNGILDFSELE